MGGTAEVERRTERAATGPVAPARVPASAPPTGTALHDVSAVDLHAPVVSAPDDAGERQAARAADDVMAGRTPSTSVSPRDSGSAPGARGPALPERAGAGVEAAVGGGDPLDTVTRSFMETSFARDFSQVRVHTGAAAAESAHSLHARAYTTGSEIVFGRGAYAPHTVAGRHLLAHELTHVAQQGHSSAGRPVQRLIRRQPTSLAAVPAAERRAITIGTTDVTVPPAQITEFFTLLPSGRPGTTLSVGATDSFGPGIPVSLQTGLGSVASWVAGQTNALPVNTSITVDLDLTAHGGARTTYRFTYFDHTTGSGRSASSSRVMLIEQVGAALTAPTQQTAPAGSSFAVGTATFRLANTWSDADYTTLRQAIALLPAAALTGASGLSFRRVRTAAGTEGGHYDQSTDTVELNDRAFRSSSLRIGQHTRAVRDVLHEIGHALDLRVLERAWTTFDTAGQTGAARTALLRTRSRSGSRYVAAGGNYGVDEAPNDVTPAFRAAARRDGVRRDTSGRTTPEGTTATLSGGGTSYSDTDYQELYAESFALYVTEPDTLRLLRPSIFAYFRRSFPRP
ncbi:DUF4157 domain-containing protein [Isoptericola sp. b408]|uniref:eCIS core domain-containing protein n=1 Tax=Isoptericola sp. b408 TaxID=3064653 RepID=UPI0027124A69|nr:DUF4157 domain-containing protein [Isoptericola sp. b408]MDO8152622.1 DUF4157 domain-containing protein [Isoptericola sp. b408]